MCVTIKTYIVDAFTTAAFKGNPAGVCILQSELSAEKMQHIAAEINLSETAFVLKDTRAADVYHIRYFTPQVEIAFCGHATVASAKVLSTYYSENDFRFLTYHGLSLPAVCNFESIKLEFPLYTPEVCEMPEAVRTGLALQEWRYCGYSKELNMMLVEIASEDAVRSLTPDYSVLMKNTTGINGVIITASASGNGYDFVSRMFAPWVGIPEDPVTGSAHSALSGYWSNKLNRTQFKALQVSKRSGILDIKVLSERLIEVTASAVVVIAGELMLPESD